MKRSEIKFSLGTLFEMVNFVYIYKSVYIQKKIKSHDYGTISVPINRKSNLIISSQLSHMICSTVYFQ